MLVDGLRRMKQYFGFSSGDKAHEFLGEMIERKCGNPDLTFKELYELYGVEFCVVVTNMSRKAAEYIHRKTKPNYSLRDAVRSSMSIPGVFTPFSSGKEVYVDGGLTNNFPLNAFDGWSCNS